MSYNKSAAENKAQREYGFFDSACAALRMTGSGAYLRPHSGARSAGYQPADSPAPRAPAPVAAPVARAISPPISLRHAPPPL